MRTTLVTHATLTLPRSLVSRCVARITGGSLLPVQRALVAEMILDVEDGMSPSIHLVEIDREPVVIFNPGDAVERTAHVVMLTIREKGSSRYFTPRLKPAMWSRTVLELAEPGRGLAPIRVDAEPREGETISAIYDPRTDPTRHRIMGTAATLLIGDELEPVPSVSGSTVSFATGGVVTPGAPYRVGDAVPETVWPVEGLKAARVLRDGGPISPNLRRFMGERGPERFEPSERLKFSDERPDNAAIVRRMAAEVEADRAKYQAMSENTASAKRKAAYALRARELGVRVDALHKAARVLDDWDRMAGDLDAARVARFRDDGGKI